jgi:hypothetical protein
MDLDFQSLWVAINKSRDYIKHKRDATVGELWNACKISFNLNRLHDPSNWKHIFVICKNMCKNLEPPTYNLAQ